MNSTFPRTDSPVLLEKTDPDQAVADEAWTAYRRALGLHEAYPTAATRDLVEFAARRWQRAFLGDDVVDNSTQLIVIQGARP